MRRAARLFLLLACATAARAGDAERNLLPNGGFEEGAAGATLLPGWTEADGLTTFFESAEGRGRVLRIDTDVNLAEADARWLEMGKPAGERPAARPKGPTHPPKYDTVAGTTGAKVFSDYHRVEPGMRYRLRFAAKSDAPTILFFVKGYAEFEGGFRKHYQWYKKVPAVEGGWATYEGTFNPTLRSPKVTHIRLMPYAYWPPGQAWIDDVEVTRVGVERETAPDAATGLLPNGDFARADLAPWTAEGPAARAEMGEAGGCGRVDAGGSLLSGRAAVEPGHAYRVTARVKPAGAVLEVVAEGVLKFEGSWVPLSTFRETFPPEAEDWLDLSMTIDPAVKAPQVTHVRVRFRALGEKGAAYVDDVAVGPAGDGGDE